MREILFRGFNSDANGKEKVFVNGEWIKGYWVEGNLFIPDKLDTPTQICIGTSTVRISYNVIPETVGPYTSLQDKNGNKIFEGDIIKCISRFDAKDMVVIFEKAEFHLVDCQRYKNYTECCGYRYFGTLETEVIGNIFENPELLKSGENNEK